MTEQALKGFIDRAADGKDIRMLFVVPRQDRVRELLHDIFYAAERKDLCPVVRMADQSVLMNGGTAVVRVAYPGFSERLRGTTWHAIHGLAYAAEDDARELQLRVREAA